MASRHRKRGRSSGGGPQFVQLHHWMLRTPAWRALSVYSRSLYVEMRARYNGSNNGGIIMSYREAQELLGCSNKPIPAAFRELQDNGFIRVSQRGSFDWKRGTGGSMRATTWALTELPIDLPIRSAMPATKDFMRWKPEKKSRHAESVPDARPERAIVQAMARPERTYGTPTACDLGRKAHPDGTLSAGTSNIPCTTGGDAGFQSMETLAVQVLDTARSRPAKS